MEQPYLNTDVQSAFWHALEAARERLSTAKAFEGILVRTGEDGDVLRRFDAVMQAQLGAVALVKLAGASTNDLGGGLLHFRDCNLEVSIWENVTVNRGATSLATRKPALYLAEQALARLNGYIVPAGSDAAGIQFFAEAGDTLKKGGTAEGMGGAVIEWVARLNFQTTPCLDE